MLKAIHSKANLSQAQADMEKAYDDLQQFKVYEKQRQEKIASLRCAAPELEARIKDSEARKHAALLRFAAGTAAEDEVKSARAALAAAREELEQTNEMIQALSLSRSGDYGLLMLAAAECRSRFCVALRDQTLQKVMSENALRRTLVHAFAALAASSDPLSGNYVKVNWKGFLSELLEAPDDKEMADAMDGLRGYFESIPAEARP